MSERRVVITGIGVISPVGSDLDTFWNNLIEGRSGITHYENFDSTGFDCHIAGEVKGFEPTNWFKTPKDARRADRFAQFAMAGTRLALDDSGLDLETIDKERFGVIVGSGIGGFQSLETEARRLVEKGPTKLSVQSDLWLFRAE